MPCQQKSYPDNRTTKPCNIIRTSQNAPNPRNPIIRWTQHERPCGNQGYAQLSAICQSPLLILPAATSCWTTTICMSIQICSSYTSLNPNCNFQVPNQAHVCNGLQLQFDPSLLPGLASAGLVGVRHVVATSTTPTSGSHTNDNDNNLHVKRHPANLERGGEGIRWEKTTKPDRKSLCDSPVQCAAGKNLLGNDNPIPSEFKNMNIVKAN
eukprot:5295793-Amphidinium_carterae.1